MGRGGANMGKILKGKSRDTTVEKKKSTSKPMTEDQFDDIKAVWDRQSRHLKEMIEQEEANSRVNQRLVTTLMRTQLRKEKLEQLNDEVAAIAHEHQREMDRKDAVVQTLQGRLGEVEEQFLVVQRSHMHKLSVISKIHKAKCRQLEAEFERDLKTVKTEFSAERELATKNHERMKKELEGIIAAVQKSKSVFEDNYRTAHDTTREEIKNKHLETTNELRINLETKIDDLGNLFDKEHNDYIDKTKEKNREFKRLQASDKEMTQENKIRKRKILKLERNLKYMKKEIEINRKLCNSRNNALKEQKEEVAGHCRNLKARMAKLRNNEKRLLMQLTVHSREANKVNDGNVTTAERILKLMEAARKMETEREKVLPFYDSTSVDLKAKEDANKLGEAFAADMKAAGDAAYKRNAKSDVTTAEEETEQWNSLENFHKKYNKVLLDKLAISQEKLRLSEENKDLRAILQQYLDGIGITEDAVDNDNSLLIINGRTNANIQAQAAAHVRRVGKTANVDANQVLAGYARHNRPTAIRR